MPSQFSPEILAILPARDEFKPGDVIEVDLSELGPDGAASAAKFNGLRGIIARPLGYHEDAAGLMDYVVSWDWGDERLIPFLVEMLGRRSQVDSLDPRVPGFYIKLAEHQELKTAWDVNWFKNRNTGG